MMLTVKMTPPAGCGRRSPRVGSVMAQRRRLVSGRATALLGGGLLLLLLLVGTVFLSNQVTNLRRSIADLEDGRDFLESRSAALLSHWNEATRPETIQARAHRELGLIRPDAPETALVLHAPEAPGRLDRWQRLLGGVTGADVAQAAGPVTTAETAAAGAADGSGRE